MIIFINSLSDLRKYVSSSMAINAPFVIHSENQLKTIFSIVTEYGRISMIDHNRLDEAIDKVSNLYKELQHGKDI